MRPPGLGQDAGDSADREREADALFVPLVASEVDREERSDSRLDVGEEKIQPVQTAQRLPRGGRFGNGGVDHQAALSHTVAGRITHGKRVRYGKSSPVANCAVRRAINNKR